MNAIAKSLIVGGMLISSAAYAASNWKVIGTSSTKNPACVQTVSVDTGSWHQSNGVVTAWTKFSNKKEKACHSEKEKEVRYQEQFDCNVRRTRLVHYHITHWDNSTDSGELVGDWSSVVPDTVGEATMDFVCAHLPK